MENNILDMLDDRIAELEGKAVKNMGGTSTKTIPSQMTSWEAVNKRIAMLEGIEDPNIDTKTGLQDTSLRIKIGFAETPEGREQVLRDAGLETQRLKDGRLTYKNKDTGKLTYVDEQGLSLQDLSDLVGTLPEMVGDVTLQTIGTNIAGPAAGAYLGSIGAMTGRVVKKGIAKYGFGINEKTDIVSDLAESGAYSLGGSAVMGGISKMLSPGKNIVKPGAVEANELLEQYGTRLTPAQMLEPRGYGEIVDWMQSVLEGSYGGGPTILRQKAGQRTAFKKMMDDIIDGLGNHMSPDEVGVIVNKAIMGKQDFFMDVITPPLFKKVDEVVGSSIPITKKVIDFANEFRGKLKYSEKKIIDETSSILDKSGKPFIKQVEKKTTKEMMPSTTNPTLRRLLDDITNLPETMTFEQAQTIRSRLLKVARDGVQTGQIGDDTSRQLKMLAKKFDEIMEDAAKKLGGDALIIWRSVNEIYRQGMEVFHDDFIEAIAKKNPELIVDAVIKNKNITNMSKVKKILGETDKDAWNRMGSMYLSKTLDNMRFDDITKTGAAKQLHHKLFTQMGEKSLKMIYDDPIIYNGLKSVIDAAVLAEEKGLSEGAAIAIKLTQFGAMGAIITGAEGRFGKIGSIGVILGPAILAKLMLSKKGSQWLTTGLMQEAGSQQSLRIIKSILSFVAEEEARSSGAGRSFGDRPATTRIPEQSRIGQRMFDY